jgi:hypothetical protein
MQKYIPLIGWAGLIFGIVTAIAAFMPGLGFFIAITAMLPGFLLSSLYVMLSSRHQVETPRIHPGYIGMVLSSVPIVLFIFYFVTT